MKLLSCLAHKVQRRVCEVFPSLSCSQQQQQQQHRITVTSNEPLTCWILIIDLHFYLYSHFFKIDREHGWGGSTAEGGGGVFGAIPLYDGEREVLVSRAGRIYISTNNKKAKPSVRALPLGDKFTSRGWKARCRGLVNQSHPLSLSLSPSPSLSLSLSLSYCLPPLSFPVSVALVIIQIILILLLIFTLWV